MARQYYLDRKIFFGGTFCRKQTFNSQIIFMNLNFSKPLTKNNDLFIYIDTNNIETKEET